MKLRERDGLAQARQVHRPDVVQRNAREKRMDPQRQRVKLRRRNLRHVERWISNGAGSDLANRLGLSTQVPVGPVFYITGRGSCQQVGI
jgi:hypothetical protein